MALALVYDRPKEKQRREFLLGLTDISSEARKRALALATSQDKRSVLNWEDGPSPDSDFEPQEATNHGHEGISSTSSTGRSSNEAVPITLCRGFHAWRLLTNSTIVGERLSKAMCSMRHKELGRQEAHQIFLAWNRAALQLKASHRLLQARAFAGSQQLQMHVLGSVFSVWSREAQAALRRQLRVNAQEELVTSVVLATTFAAWRSASLRSGTINGLLQVTASSRARDDQTQVLGAVFSGWSREAQVASRRRIRVNAQEELAPSFLMAMTIAAPVLEELAPSILLATTLAAWRRLTSKSVVGDKVSKAMCSMHCKELDGQVLLGIFLGWRRATLQSGAINRLLQVVLGSQGEASFLLALLQGWHAAACHARTKRDSLEAVAGLRARHLGRQATLHVFTSWWHVVSASQQQVKVEGTQHALRAATSVAVLTATWSAWSRLAQVVLWRQHRVNAQEELAAAFMLGAILAAWRRLSSQSMAGERLAKAMSSIRKKEFHSEVLQFTLSAWNHETQRSLRRRVTPQQAP
eukprot:s839_g24.t2